MSKTNYIPIIDFIPLGKENAITRKQLEDLTGMKDRHIRDLIEFARESGEIILSSSHHQGYWKSDDISEVRQFVNETRSRIHKLEKSKVSAEKALVCDMMAGGDLF